MYMLSLSKAKRYIHVGAFALKDRKLKDYIMVLNQSKEFGQAADWIKAASQGKKVRVEVLGTFVSVEIVAESIFDNYESMVAHRGGSLMVGKADFINYIKSLFYYRLEFINSNSHIYNKLKYKCFLPHIFCTAMAVLGNGLHSKTGQFMLVDGIKDGDNSINDWLLNEKSMLEISMRLELLSRNLNISMASELPKDKTGNVDVLFFNDSSNGLFGSQNDVSSSLAVLALLLETKPDLSEDVFPVSYVPKDLYFPILLELARISIK